jgi:hypothetical protein
MSDTGKTVARRSVYVGEHVENTGPNAIPVIIARRRGFPISWALSSELDERESQRRIPILVQTWGKIYISHKKIRIIPEKFFQKLGGISIKRVETFKSSVKRTIEKARENVTTYGYHFFSRSDSLRESQAELEEHKVQESWEHQQQMK